MDTADIVALVTERESTHGEFNQTAAVVQSLSQALYRHSGSTAFTPPQQHAIDMIIVKLARIVAGDRYHEDHWRDIAGYATLVANGLERMPRRV